MKIENLLKKLEYTPYRNDRKPGGGRIMIAIKNSYNHDEMKLHGIPESEIKFEDKPRVVQWFEVNLKI